jgi:crotonobetaine/carnitine-CoA ligase
VTNTFTTEDADAFQMRGQDVPWLLNHWATNKPDHPFLIWDPREGDARTWTYAQFLTDARNLAAGLAARGIVKHDKVLLHCDNAPELVLSWFACALLGAVGVTTNTRSAGPEVEYFASHTRCVAGITQPQYAALVAANAPNLRFLAITADNSGEVAEPVDRTALGGTTILTFAELFGDGSTLAARPAEPMLPVGIMFTSGTTSRPKAVVHTHGNVIWSSRIGPENIKMSSDSRYLIYLPYFHVNAQSWSTWTTLGVGGTIVLTPKWSASRFWELVTKHGITHFSMMPFVMKAAMSGPIPENTLQVGAFGLISPQIEQMMGGIRITSNWGMTETVIHATRNQFDQHYPQGTMGRPTPGYEFLVVDTDGGPGTETICGPGENGELYVRGTRGIQLFLEYFDNDEANQKAFTADGWFRTGDRVVMSEEGYFFFRDRDKDALKVGGENVSAKEVEDTCRQVSGVADVAIVGQEHEFLSQVAVAFVIPTPNAPADLDEQLMAFCKTRLADFKCPKAVYLVEDFPRATLDKVAKNKLREMADAALRR